jgi:iron complex transport system substrate-binding protein
LFSAAIRERTVGRRGAAWVAALALPCALAACGGTGDAKRAVSASPDSAVSVVDDAGHTVTLPHPARRIVSLVPSATETLLALGARGALVGRNDFDKGMGIDSLPSVGGGMDPSLERLVALRPDVVVGWNAGSDPAARQRIEALGIRLFALKTEDTTDVFRAVRSLGALTGRRTSADSLSASMRRGLADVAASVAGKPRPRVFFVVWNDPPMTAGPRTYVAQLIGVAGGTNTFADAARQWPTVSLEEIVRRDPDVVVLPQGEKGAAASIAALRGAPGWRELRAMKDGHAVTVPADLVNRPGPHIAEAARALAAALHPDAASP